MSAQAIKCHEWWGSPLDNGLRVCYSGCMVANGLQEALDRHNKSIARYEAQEKALQELRTLAEQRKDCQAKIIELDKLIRHLILILIEQEIPQSLISKVTGVSRQRIGQITNGSKT